MSQSCSLLSVLFTRKDFNADSRNDNCITFNSINVILSILQPDTNNKKMAAELYMLYT